MRMLLSCVELQIEFEFYFPGVLIEVNLQNELQA